MKTLKLIGFAIIGAMFALFPIYFGDLRFMEQLLVGFGVAGLGVSGIILTYNMLSTHKEEVKGNFTKGLPLTENAIAGAIGGVIMVLLQLL